LKNREFQDLNNRLCSAPVLSFPNLQQSFDIENDAYDYEVGEFLTRNGHLGAYHSETLSNIVRKYPTYDKEMYSIVHRVANKLKYLLKKKLKY
jgi:hypothetical protein